MYLPASSLYTHYLTTGDESLSLRVFTGSIELFLPGSTLYPVVNCYRVEPLRRVVLQFDPSPQRVPDDPTSFDGCFDVAKALTVEALLERLTDALGDDEEAFLEASAAPATDYPVAAAPGDWKTSFPLAAGNFVRTVPLAVVYWPHSPTSWRHHEKRKGEPSLPRRPK